MVRHVATDADHVTMVIDIGHVTMTRCVTLSILYVAMTRLVIIDVSHVTMTIIDGRRQAGRCR